MEIAFDTTPDETGKGRVIVNGRFYGLPSEAVAELERKCAELYVWRQMGRSLHDAGLRVVDVPNAEVSGAGTASAGLPGYALTGEKGRP